MDCGPITRSTAGWRCMISAPSAWATQPATTIVAPFAALRPHLVPPHLQAAELGVDLLRRLLADVAGVQHHEVGVVLRSSVRA